MLEKHQQFKKGWLDEYLMLFYFLQQNFLDTF